MAEDSDERGNVDLPVLGKHSNINVFLRDKRRYETSVVVAIKIPEQKIHTLSPKVRKANEAPAFGPLSK